MERVVGLAHLPAEILGNITCRLTAYDVVVSLRNCGDSVLWTKLQRGGLIRIFMDAKVSQNARFLTICSFQTLTTLEIDISIPQPCANVLCMLSPGLKELILRNQLNMTCWLRKMTESEICDPVNHHIRMDGHTPLILSGYYPNLITLIIRSKNPSYMPEWPMGLRIRFLLGLPTSIRQLMVDFRVFEELDVFRFLPPHLERLNLCIESVKEEKLKSRPISLQSSLSSICLEGSRQHSSDPNETPGVMRWMQGWLPLREFRYLGGLPRSPSNWHFSDLEILQTGYTSHTHLFDDEFVSFLPKSLRHIIFAACSVSPNVKWPPHLLSLNISTTSKWKSLDSLPKSLKELYWISDVGDDPMQLLQMLPPNLTHFASDMPLATSPIDLSHLPLVNLHLVGNISSMTSRDTRYPSSLTDLSLSISHAQQLHALENVSDQFLSHLPPRLIDLYLKAIVRESQLVMVRQLRSLKGCQIAFENGHLLDIVSDRNANFACISNDSVFSNGKFRMEPRSRIWNNIQQMVIFPFDSYELHLPSHISSLSFELASSASFSSQKWCIKGKEMQNGQEPTTSAPTIQSLSVRCLPVHIGVDNLDGLPHLTELTVSDAIESIGLQWLQLPLLKTLNVPNSSLVADLHLLPVSLTSLHLKKSDELCRNIAHLTNLKTLIITPAPPHIVDVKAAGIDFLPASLTSLTIGWFMLPNKFTLLKSLQPGPLGEPPSLTHLESPYAVAMADAFFLSPILKTLNCLGVTWEDNWTQLLAQPDETEVESIEGMTSYLIKRLQSMVSPMILTLQRQIPSYTNTDRKWAKNQLEALPRSLKSLTASGPDSFSARFASHLPSSLTYLDLLGSSYRHIPSNSTQYMPRHLSTLKCGAKMFCLNSYQSLPPSLTHFHLIGAKKFKSSCAEVLPKQLLILHVEVNRYDMDCIKLLPRSLVELYLLAKVSLDIPQMRQMRDSYPPNLRSLKLSFHASTPISTLLSCFPPGPQPLVFSFDHHQISDALFLDHQKDGRTPEALVGFPTRNA